MSLRRIWANLRRNIVPLVISLVGVVCGLAGTFRSFGASEGWALGLGLAAAALILISLAVFLHPRGDERLFSHRQAPLFVEAVRDTEGPVLCRRHLTGRAQERVLICAAATATEDGVKWIANNLGATGQEVLAETKFDKVVLAARIGTLEALYKGIVAINTTPGILALAKIAASDAGLVPGAQDLTAQQHLSVKTNEQLRQTAEAIRERLLALQDAVKRDGVDELVRLADSPIWSDTQLNEAAINKAVRATYVTVAGLLFKWSQIGWNDILDDSRRLGELSRKLWRDDRQAIAANAGCTATELAF
jgi:hypothetical protein